MTLRTGIDLIEIARLQQAIDRHRQRFLRRIFTAQELADCAGNIASLAVRFAAKEAVAKALGTGIGAVGWHEIEIQRGESREPLLRLSGAAAEMGARLGVQTWSLSLSHTQEIAAAMVVGM